MPEKVALGARWGKMPAAARFWSDRTMIGTVWGLALAAAFLLIGASRTLKRDWVD